MKPLQTFFSEPSVPVGWKVVVLKSKWMDMFNCMFKRKQPWLFGWCMRSSKIVAARLMPLFGWTRRVILWHESGHAWGITKCTKMRCLMYESDSWWKERIAIIPQLLYGVRFCGDCQKRIDNAKNTEK